MSVSSKAALPVSSALLTLMLGGLQAVMPLSIDLYLPGLPTIARDLGVSSGAAQSTLAIFLAGVALGQLVYGPVTDKFGRKTPLIFGLALYVAGAVLCALAPSIAVLIAGRFLQALGASASAVITFAVVRDLWSGKALADRLSLLVLVMGVAPIFAPSLGGVILTQTSWHGLFWFLAIFGALMAAVVTLLPETSSAHERSQVRLRQSAATYAALLRSPPFLLPVLAGASMLGVLFAYITGSPFLFIGTLGVSAGSFAVLFSATALGFVLASQLNRLLLRRLELLTVARGAALSAVLLSALLIVVQASGHASVLTLTPLLFLVTASVSCTLPNTAALAFGSVNERLGSASALQGTAQSVLGAVAGALVSGLSKGAALPMMGVMAAFAVLAVFFLTMIGRADRANRLPDPRTPGK